MNKNESMMQPGKRYIVVLEMYGKENETREEIANQINNEFRGHGIFSVQEKEYKDQKTRFKIVLCNLMINDYSKFIKFFLANDWSLLVEWFAEQHISENLQLKNKPRKTKKVAKDEDATKPKAIVSFEPKRSVIPKTMPFKKHMLDHSSLTTPEK